MVRIRLTLWLVLVLVLVNSTSSFSFLDGAGPSAPVADKHRRAIFDLYRECIITVTTIASRAGCAILAMMRASEVDAAVRERVEYAHAVSPSLTTSSAAAARAGQPISTSLAATALASASVAYTLQTRSRPSKRRQTTWNLFATLRLSWCGISAAAASAVARAAATTTGVLALFFDRMRRVFIG